MSNSAEETARRALANVAAFTNEHYTMGVENDGVVRVRRADDNQRLFVADGWLNVATQLEAFNYGLRYRPRS